MPLIPDIDPSLIDSARVAQRRAVVSDVVAKVRQIESEQGVNRQSLEAIAQLLVELSQRADLFGIDEFPNPDPDAIARLYVLNEDEDGRFPLYLVCSLPGGSVPPHNHTTWAVVAGLSGDEKNVLYERTDGAQTPGSASLRERKQELIQKGGYLALMPEDIHAVSTPGDVPRRHFHMYGLSLDRLPTRLIYDLQAGSCKYMQANQKVVRLAHA